MWLFSNKNLKYLKSIITINLNECLCNGKYNQKDLFSFIYLYARGYSYIIDDQSIDASAYLITICNGIAPVVDKSIILTEEAARSAVRSSTIYLMCNEKSNNLYYNVAQKSYEITMKNELMKGNVPTWDEFRPDNIDFLDNNKFSFDGMIKILNFLASYGTSLLKSIAIKSFIETYIALIKRGATFSNTIEKINEQIHQNIGITIDNCYIQEIYGQIGNLIHHKNAEKAFLYWQKQLQNYNTLRITLRHVIGSRITPLITIRVAFVLFPNFKWKQVETVFPEQMEFVANALKDCETNPYYEFNPNLKGFSSLKFKDIIWVAKELLAKWNGTRFDYLVHYCCKAKCPNYRDTVIKLVKEFQPETVVSNFSKIDNVENIF